MSSAQQQAPKDGNNLRKDGGEGERPVRTAERSVLSGQITA